MVKAKEELIFCWYNSITSIAEEDWNKCFQNKGTIGSYAYQKSVEISNPAGVQFHYLVAKQAGSIVAIVGCFEYKFPLETLMPQRLKALIEFIRKFYKQFFKLKIFFAGHLTSVGDHLFGFNIAHNQLNKMDVLAQLCKSITTKAKELKALITIIKEIPEVELTIFQQAIGSDFLFVHSLPDTYLKLDTDLSYTEQLRGKYKQLRNVRERKMTDAGITWEVHKKCTGYEDIIEKLYLEPLARSENKFESLNSSFFYYIGEYVEEAFFILAKKQNEIVGFALNSTSDNSLQALYLGYNGDYKDSALYFGLFYKTIDEAVARKKEYVWLGQTSYEVKSSMGAIISKLYLGVHVRNKLIKFILKRYNAVLFPEINLPIRNVWSDSRKF